MLRKFVVHWRFQEPLPLCHSLWLPWAPVLCPWKIYIAHVWHLTVIQGRARTCTSRREAPEQGWLAVHVHVATKCHVYYCGEYADIAQLQFERYRIVADIDRGSHEHNPRHWHTHTHTQTRTRAHTHTHTHTHTHIHIHIHWLTHTNTHAQILTDTNTHTPTRTYTHIHTLTHTHIYTFSSQLYIHTQSHTHT